MDIRQYHVARENVPPVKLDAVPSWGRDGWDLGEWPYVKVSHGIADDGRHVVSYYVEGDRDFYVTPDETTRNEVTDYLAWFHWQGRYDGGDWSLEDMPAERRGPFSWARLEAETATA